MFDKKEEELNKPRFPNTPVGTFGWWGGAAALLVPTTKDAWPGVGKSPTAPAATSAVLPPTSSSAATFTAASSMALFTAASFAALLSVASLSATTASSSAVELGPVSGSHRNHFYRGSSFSNDTSSSSRTTHTYLPLLRARAGPEPPAGLPPRPPARVPLWLPTGLSLVGTPLQPTDGPPPRP
jgi:hypothetical protein